MSGRRSRSKGSRGELEVAAILNEYGFTASRNARNGIAGRDGGQDVAHNIPGAWIEVKRAESLQIPKWLRQTESDCPEGDTPLLIFRQSHQPWRAVLRLTDLLTLIRERGDSE